MNTKYLDWRPRRWFFNTFCHNFFSEWSSINYLTRRVRWKYSRTFTTFTWVDEKLWTLSEKTIEAMSMSIFKCENIYSIELDASSRGLQAKQESELWEKHEIYVFVFHEINQLLIKVNGDWSPTVFILLKQHPFTRLCWAQTNKLVCCPRSQRQAFLRLVSHFDS